jgi:hypothetical protein
MMSQLNRNRLVGIVGCLVLAGIFSCRARAEQDMKSGNFFIPHCEHYLTDNIHYDVWDGDCSGIISALLFFDRSLTGDIRFCSPKGVTQGQAARVVLSFLQANPARLHHEDFRALAVIPLHRAWPCPK